MQALDLFRKKTGVQQFFKVDLDKQVPAGKHRSEAEMAALKQLKRPTGISRLIVTYTTC